MRGLFFVSLCLIVHSAGTLHFLRNQFSELDHDFFWESYFLSHLNEVLWHGLFKMGDTETKLLCAVM